MRPRLHSLIILLLALLMLSTSYGQAVDGFVLDQDRIPVEGAHIFNLNSKSHAHSDEFGSFRLVDVATGDSIVATFVGYKKTFEIVRELNEPLEILMSSTAVSLREIVVAPRQQPLAVLRDVDLRLTPVSSSQEVLRQVPGLFIGQHAGGGKAEQIFLRGFDIDHGTDVGLTVDGMPVNMVSHAHGQGYADLHFLIPETIDNIDFSKGAYEASQGNFVTAGHVNFRSKDRLSQNLVKLEGGQFNTQRFLGMFDVVSSKKVDVYVAAESIATDGPFDSPQNFNRQNVMAKMSARPNNQDHLTAQLSYFSSRWDASGQVPVRAVESGMISRFGAIDDTEGGQTSRANVQLAHSRHISNRTYVKNMMYYSHYNFELFSNFTFFLNDTVNGDQIYQHENRDLFGLKSEVGHSFDLGDYGGVIRLGIDLRNDKSRDNELLRTLNRSTQLSAVQSGDIDERNTAVYTDVALELGKWHLEAGLRADHFSHAYRDALSTVYSNKVETASILSPKLKVNYQMASNLQVYLGAGTGFHSNDTRVVVAQSAREILPAAYSGDLGLIWKPMDRMVLNLAAWSLFLEQEFVYVGDEGVVEASGRTQRNGLDLSMRYEPINRLFWTLDANYTHARSVDEAEGENYIPLAPDLTMVSGLSWLSDKGWYGGLSARYMDDRAANEDNSIIAEGYTVLDANLGYVWKSLDASIQVQNLLDTEWNETQFATESRLYDESMPVEEIHFTPGTPLFVKGSIAFRF